MKLEIKKELYLLIPVIHLEEIKFPHNESSHAWQNLIRMITDFEEIHFIQIASVKYDLEISEI